MPEVLAHVPLVIRAIASPIMPLANTAARESFQKGLSEANRTLIGAEMGFEERENFSFYLRQALYGVLRMVNTDPQSSTQAAERLFETLSAWRRQMAGMESPGQLRSIVDGAERELRCIILTKAPGEFLQPTMRR